MDYKQDNKENSVNQQAETINNYGLTAKDVMDICQKLFDENFYHLSEVAKKTANKRATEICKDFLSELQKSESNNLKVVEDPDFQYTFFEAQKNYARTGDKDQESMLINLLVERTKHPERDILQIVLDESVTVLSKLTKRQIDLLSFIFMVGYTRYTVNFDIQFFCQAIERELSPLTYSVTKNYTDIQHLVFCGCGTESIGSKNILSIYKSNYPGLFSKGMNEAEIEQENLSVDYNSPIFIRKGKNYYINAVSAEALGEICQRLKISDSDKEKLKNMLLKYTLTEEEVKKEIVRHCPFMNNVIKIYNDSKISHFVLSSVGLAIGYANIKQILGSFSDLNIWINDKAGKDE